MKRGLFAGNALFKEAEAGVEGWDTNDDEDGGGADDDGEEGSEDEEGVTEEQQRTALLNKIRGGVQKQLEGQDKKTAIAVRKMIDEALKGVNVEGLRKFKGDKVAESVRNLAKKIDDIKTAFDKGAGAGKRDFLKELVETKMEEMEKVLRSKVPGKEVTLSTRVAVTMTTDNVVSGALDEDIVESFSMEAFQKDRRPKEYISDIASITTVSETTEFKFWYSEGDIEGAFAIVGEGVLKPLVSRSLVREQSTVAKAAGKEVYTEEVPKFRKRIYAILRDLFNDQIWRDYQAILTTRLIAAAAAYPGTALDGTIAAPTDFHAIGAVASAIETLNFNPDVLIINPQDKWRIALTQDLNGQFYLMAPQMGADGVVRMMQFRVITTNRIAVGKFILGESGLYKVEQEGMQVRMGYGINVTTSGGNVTAVEHDFDHNRFRIIGELFFHSFIKAQHAGSFIYGDFAAIKTALLDTP